MPRVQTAESLAELCFFSTRVGGMPHVSSDLLSCGRGGSARCEERLRARPKKSAQTISFVCVVVKDNDGMVRTSLQAAIF